MKKNWFHTGVWTGDSCSLSDPLKTNFSMEEKANLLSMRATFRETLVLLALGMKLPCTSREGALALWPEASVFPWEWRSKSLGFGHHQNRGNAPFCSEEYAERCNDSEPAEPRAGLPLWAGVCDLSTVAGWIMYFLIIYLCGAVRIQDWHSCGTLLALFSVFTVLTSTCCGGKQALPLFSKALEQGHLKVLRSSCTYNSAPRRLLC